MSGDSTSTKKPTGTPTTCGGCGIFKHFISSLVPRNGPPSTTLPNLPSLASTVSKHHASIFSQTIPKPAKNSE